MIFSVVVNCKPLEWNAKCFQLLFDFPRLIDETFSVLFGAYFFVPFNYWHVIAEKNINSFFGRRKQRWSRTDTNHEEKSNDIDEPFVEQKAKAEHSDSTKKLGVVWKWGLIALAANLNN